MTRMLPTAWPDGHEHSPRVPCRVYDLIAVRCSACNLRIHYLNGWLLVPPSFNPGELRTLQRANVA